MSDITVVFTPAEQNIVRQALRAERDRMIKQGYSQLAKLADDTSSKIANIVIDTHASMV